MGIKVIPCSRYKSSVTLKVVFFGIPCIPLKVESRNQKRNIMLPKCLASLVAFFCPRHVNGEHTGERLTHKHTVITKLTEGQKDKNMKDNKKDSEVFQANSNELK